MCFHLLLLKSVSFCPSSLAVQMVGVRLHRHCVSGLKSWTTLAWCAVFSKPQVFHWWLWWSQIPFLSRRLKPCQPKQRFVVLPFLFGPSNVVSSCSNNKISRLFNAKNSSCQVPSLTCIAYFCRFRTWWPSDTQPAMSSRGRRWSSCAKMAAWGSTWQM